MRPLIILLLVCFSLISNDIKASLTCPPNVTLTCDSDLSDFNYTGYPILGGTHIYIGASYQDQDFTTLCGVGHVIRRWYVDLNGDNQLSTDEPYCDQTITLIDIPREITFDAPRDVTIDCLDDIPSSTVTWTAGPCDFIGYDSEDLIFEISNDACYKIMRKHTLIDWCVYAPHDPNWNGEGLYIFKQYIKVIDNQEPVIKICEAKEYEVGTECKTEVTLTNSAVDLGSCPSADLYWEVEIDLWANGDIDYVFSYLLTGKFNIPTKANNEEVSIKIPELLKPGNHKVKWKVKDGCGNWESCLTTFKTVDKKAPTPYCHQVIYASFDGSNNGSVDIPASMFNVGSFDNCSAPEYLSYAFSNDVNDDTLNISCLNQGFQFLNVYAFDERGNSDFCVVYMLIFDNGLCNSRFSPQGTTRLANGNQLPYVDLHVSRPNEFIGSWLSNPDGKLQTQDIPLFDDITFKPTLNGLDKDKIDVEDYLMLLDHLLGKKPLQYLSILAADLDDNKKVSVQDLKLLKDFVLGRNNHFNDRDWSFVANHQILNFSLKSHNNSLKITEFDGDLDFIGVMKGDLSNQTLDSTITRSNPILPLYKTTSNEGYTAFYLSENIALKGLQLSITLDQLIDMRSGQLDLNVENLYSDNSQVNLLLTDVGFINTEEPLFYVKAGSINSISGKAISAENIKFSLKEQIYNLDLILYPNPAANSIVIEGIQDDPVVIVNMVGQSMAIIKKNGSSFEISTYPNGRYIVKSGNKVASFIKVD